MVPRWTAYFVCHRANQQFRMLLQHIGSITVVWNAEGMCSVWPPVHTVRGTGGMNVQIIYVCVLESLRACVHEMHESVVKSEAGPPLWCIWMNNTPKLCRYIHYLRESFIGQYRWPLRQRSVNTCHGKITKNWIVMFASCIKHNVHISMLRIAKSKWSSFVNVQNVYVHWLV